MPHRSKAIRFVLRVLPRRFRARFGDEWIETVTALSTEARHHGGRRAQALYLAREAATAIGLGVTLRRSHHCASSFDPNGATMSAILTDDFRWAGRYLRRRPVFTLAIGTTLAVSIAIATTAFGLATAVLWRPLPFRDANRLTFVWEEAQRDGQARAQRVTSGRFAAWRDVDSGLASMSLFHGTAFTIDRDGSAASLRGVAVSPNYFDTLGIAPALGRGFVAADEEPGNHRVVILSNAFWRDQFGASPSVIGSELRLSGQPYTVVGVMPAATFPAWPLNPAIVTLDADARAIWVPIQRTPQLDQDARGHVYGVIARLGPTATPSDVVQRLNRTSDPSAADPHRARLMPMRDQFVSDARTPLTALFGAAIALLLIACANLAALYVSAIEGRRGELAVRAAIGAGTIRIVRQLAIEALLLAAGGAIGGLVLSQLALSALPDLLPPTIPFLTRPDLDLRAAAFAAGLCGLATMLMIGWPIARVLLSPPMSRGTIAGQRQLIYRVLVVAQVAVTMALVASAGLLGQSLYAVQRRDPGFDVDRTLIGRVGLPTARNTPADAVARAEQSLLTAIARRPNVEAVTAAYDHPLQANWSESPTLIGETTTPDARKSLELRIVSPGYFEALNVQLLEGRTFTERDAAGAPGAALVNEAYAREAGGPVIGRRLRSNTPRFSYGEAVPNEFEIVGIVANERFRGLEQPSQPAFYLSTRQFPQTGFSLIVRTTGDPISATPDVRAAIRELDPAITFDRPVALDAILNEQLGSRRVTADVIGGFAFVALALAALGVYGLLAVLVGSRTREIGIRIAIGASPAIVARQVLSSSVVATTIGVAIGCVLAIASGRFVSSLLVDVSPYDPVTLVFVATTLVVVAFVAGVAPARRAARVDPVTALRAE